MTGGNDLSERIERRVRACDYLTVAQLFLQDNFLLERPLSFDDIKPRLLGHWGTCHGINVAYANLREFFPGPAPQAPLRRDMPPTADELRPKLEKQKRIEKAYEETPLNPFFHFILGPGHGFPALQANLFFDNQLAKVNAQATRTLDGLSYICRNFSWPGGFPSHASPFTPGVICEGGELGYALGAAYGLALGHPEKIIAVLLGDGELETASALSSLNLVKLAGDQRYHGRVLPILHLNGYKISGPTLYGRKSEREIKEFVRGFGYTPFCVEGDAPDAFQAALRAAAEVHHPFIIFRNEKGATGPKELNGQKIAGNFRAHQIPLPDAKTDKDELRLLEDWLKSYRFSELFNPEKGFTL